MVHMVPNSRPGRPRKRPASPLGGVIAESMAAKGIPLGELAERLQVSRTTLWRLLHGKTEFSRRVTVDTLARALGLREEERPAFLDACARYTTEAEGSPAVDADKRPPAGRSRDVDGGLEEFPKAILGTSPTLRFAVLLKERMTAQGVSQSQMARHLNVAPSTISRLTRGKLASTHVVNVQRICHLLKLAGMDRRAFLALAGQACLLPIVYRAGAEHLRFRPFEQSLGRPLDEFGEEIEHLRERRNRGEVAEVYRRAGDLFDRLFNRRVPAQRVERSPELAHARLLVGFELCEAQAAHLGWYARTDTMIQTLDRMESDVLLHFPPKQFASEHHHLLNLRGPLYYKRLHQKSAADGYLEAIGELTRALDSLMSLQYEPTLRVELLRNRAHAYLLLGHEHESRWWKDLELARNVAAGIRSEGRETFQALVEYSLGEGYKQLGYGHSLRLQVRKQYMEKALSLLAQSKAIFHQHHRWQGYALLADIAEAQCLIWQDADEALRRARHVRSEAQRFYPSLLAKIERVAGLAERQRLPASRK